MEKNKKIKSMQAATTYDLCWPTESSRITQSYGGGHNGTDIGAVSAGVAGDEIYAYMDGYVAKVTTPTYNPNEGYSVRLHHDGNPGSTSYARIRTQYMHMNGTPTVEEGDYVSAGDVIGYMGSSGNADSVHLHFEVKGGTSKQFPIPGTSAYATGSFCNSDDYLDLV